MEETIVNQSCRKYDAVVHLGVPVVHRIQCHSQRSRLNLTSYREAGYRCSGEWHGGPRSREIAKHDKGDHIAARLEVRGNVECIIVPYGRTTSKGTNGQALPIDIELVSRIRRKVQDGTIRMRRQIKLAGELDEPSC